MWDENRLLVSRRGTIDFTSFVLACQRGASVSNVLAAHSVWIARFFSRTKPSAIPRPEPRTNPRCVVTCVRARKIVSPRRLDCFALQAKLRRLYRMQTVFGVGQTTL